MVKCRTFSLVALIIWKSLAEASLAPSLKTFHSYEESLGQSCTEDTLLAYHCYLESFVVFRDVRKGITILCVPFLIGKQDELE